jgi:hypothetical protein
MIQTADDSRIGVLYIFVALPVGGAEQLLYNTVKYLDKSRFLPVVCCLGKRGEMGERISGLSP